MLCAVIGSLEHPISSVTVEGALTADGGSYGDSPTSNPYDLYNSGGGSGGGSGGTILLFVNSLSLGESGVLSSGGGYGNPNGSGGGGGGRIHFHWSHISTGDVYQPVASVQGNISIGFVFHILASVLCLITYFIKNLKHKIGHFNFNNITVCYCYSGGLGGNDRGTGGNGTVTGRSCPKGLYGTFCEVY